MADNLKIVRIFIGSPGGLEEERQAAHAVVESVNRSHSERWGCYFRLLGWETAVPGFVRPQSKINEDLDRCDYFIGVLWDRWGSPPSTNPDGPTSGFQEEYLRAEMRIEKGLMNDMALYFKEVSVPPGMEPGDEIRKVLDFRNKCIDEKKVFFKNFSDLQSFRDALREKIEEIGWRETALISNEHQQINQSKKTPTFQDNSGDEAEPDDWLIDEKARHFLAELTQRSPDWDSTAPYEVARLRLIGTAVSRSGNDDSYLGNHDANLIFQKLRSVQLSQQENRALIDCGITGFEHQNVPLWRWLSKGENKNGTWDRVNLLAAIGNEAEKRNALKILKLASQPVPSFGEHFGKKQILSVWLSDETDNRVFDAAISFLSSNAERDDLPLLQEAADNCSPYRRAKVETAIVSILSQTSLDDALKRLVEKEIDNTEDSLAEELFRNPPSLTTETMLSCLSAKSDSIRLRAAQVLFARDEITSEAAETLLTDSNHEIRLLAAETMKKQGNELDDELAKKALRIIKPPPAFGLRAFQSSETDDTLYERYVANRLSELNFSELKSKVKETLIFDDRELSVFYSKYKSKLQQEIRDKLKDCFKNHFEAKVREAVASGSLDSNSEAKLRKVESFHRKQLCSLALSSLCGLAKSQDLSLVRNTLKEIEVDATESILMYLARYGDWSDIELVKKLGDYSIDRSGLLGIYKTKLPDQKAAAILALGRARIADMLALDLDSSIRISLIKQIPKKDMAGMSDELLLRELVRKDDAYRIVFALRCVQALSKARVTSLLDRYVDSDEHSFYNSIHWLDLGASLPRRLAKTIAERALLNQ